MNKARTLTSLHQENLESKKKTQQENYMVSMCPCQPLRTPEAFYSKKSLEYKT